MNQSIVCAPPHLGTHTRSRFQDDALAAISRLAESAPGGQLVVDLSQTQRVDSAGLGMLVMIQLRAAELKHGVVLRAASEEIRFLLLMTRLEDRFIIE